MNNITIIRKHIQLLFPPGKHSIIAIYVFGSYAKGKEKTESDIDLAFVYDQDFYHKDPFRAFQDAALSAAEMGEKMRKKIEGVILNGSSLSFAYCTVKDGICVYESSTAERILYEVLLENKYQDFMPFIRELREVKRKSLLGRN